MIYLIVAIFTDRIILVNFVLCTFYTLMPINLMAINESGGTFFVGFIIEYLEKLNAIILIIYSSQPYNVVCEHQVFALRGSD